MDVPLSAYRIKESFYICVLRSVKVSQKSMQQFTTGHSWSGFGWPRQVDKDNFGHYFLVLYSCSHELPPFIFGQFR